VEATHPGDRYRGSPPQWDARIDVAFADDPLGGAQTPDGMETA
jgi:hypothetical protein